MSEPIVLGSGSLPLPASDVPQNRWIVPATETTPAVPYKKTDDGLDWQEMTVGLLTRSYLEYSAVDLVTTFETGLIEP